MARASITIHGLQIGRHATLILDGVLLFVSVKSLFARPLFFRDLCAVARLNVLFILQRNFMAENTLPHPVDFRLI